MQGSIPVSRGNGYFNGEGGGCDQEETHDWGS